MTDTTMTGGEAHPRINYRLTDALGAEIGRRVTTGISRHQVAKRDLERYYDALRLELAALRLSPPEWQAIEAALEGEYLDIIATQALPDTVAEALAHEGIGALFGIDDAELTAKLARTSFTQRLAIVDEIERRRIARRL